MSTGLPPARAGEVIGLLGGSFDPAHEGHVRITRTALARFGLDRVWWLVSPGNPLKDRGPAPVAVRMERARALMRHPRVCVTDLETRLGTRHTAQTLEQLARRYPGVRFVWLMGADNLAQIHRWQDWRRIFARVPVGVLARPGSSLAGLAPAARIMAGARLPARGAALLGRAAPPAWCLVALPMSPASSSDMRARGLWGAEGAKA
ncbi:MAG: nicotinate-nucleotide adenylyltransferase [Rubellimicrobium sp.]|nr:nicotinate-nucleotide adenylyltransferase [Rubellimicrobium sp.]